MLIAVKSSWAFCLRLLHFLHCVAVLHGQEHLGLRRTWDNGAPQRSRDAHWQFSNSEYSMQERCTPFRCARLHFIFALKSTIFRGPAQHVPTHCCRRDEAPQCGYCCGGNEPAGGAQAGERAAQGHCGRGQCFNPGAGGLAVFIKRAFASGSFRGLSCKH